MDQEPLFFEDIYDALRHAVHRLGGAKIVGASLFPEKMPDKAAEYLLACLNRDRAEKLSMEHFLWIRREARKVGCHVIAAFENQDSGYAPPQPVEPQDEVAELQRQFMANVQSSGRIAQRMEQLFSALKAVK